MQDIGHVAPMKESFDAQRSCDPQVEKRCLPSPGLTTAASEHSLHSSTPQRLLSCRHSMEATSPQCGAFHSH